MSGQDFSSVKSGDRLWHYELNSVVIVTSVSNTYLDVKIETTNRIFMCGKDGLNDAGAQVLFWSKPPIIAPEKPKKMVKKEFDVSLFNCQGMYIVTFKNNNEREKADVGDKVIKAKLIIEVEE